MIKPFSSMNPSTTWDQADMDPLYVTNFIRLQSELTKTSTIAAIQLSWTI